MREAIWVNLLFACPFDIGEAGEDLAVDDVELHIGDALSEADMGANPEGEMVFGIAAVNVDVSGSAKTLGSRFAAP